MWQQGCFSTQKVLRNINIVYVSLEESMNLTFYYQMADPDWNTQV